MTLKKEESARRIVCITEREGFDSVRLNAWVLLHIKGKLHVQNDNRSTKRILSQFPFPKP